MVDPSALVRTCPPVHHRCRLAVGTVTRPPTLPQPARDVGVPLEIETSQQGLPLIDTNMHPFFQLLGPANMLLVVESILLEKNILVFSRNVAMLAPFMEVQPPHLQCIPPTPHSWLSLGTPRAHPPVQLATPVHSRLPRAYPGVCAGSNIPHVTPGLSLVRA